MVERDSQKYPRRKLRNFMLDPGFQLKYAAYFFLFAVFATMYGQWSVFDYIHKEVITVILERAAGYEALEWLNPVTIELGLRLVGFIGILSIVCIFAAIIITHRVAGPVVALKRHVVALQQGNYHVKTRLRKNDHLVELGEELNKLSDALSKKHNTDVSESSEKTA